MLKVIFMIAAAALVTQCSESSPTAKTPPNNKNANLKIVVEPDQTDIFAIPLDEDADEMRDQVNELRVNELRNQTPDRKNPDEKKK